MELCGVALVQWDGDGTAIGDADDKPRGDCNKEEYFKEKIPLMEKGNYVICCSYLEQLCKEMGPSNSTLQHMEG